MAAVAPVRGAGVRSTAGREGVRGRAGAEKGRRWCRCHAAKRGGAGPSDAGLSRGQRSALGVLKRRADTEDGLGGFQVDEKALTAKYHYRPDHPVYDYEGQGDNLASATRMYAGGHAVVAAGGYGGANVAPPDLPSLLLNGRICFLGMPLVPQVTELIVAQLLYLNYDTGGQGQGKPAYLYINSSGSQTEQKQTVGFETEATAIIDTISYIRVPVHTVAISKAHGNAALLLAAGEKGRRASLPHASIKISPPRLNRAAGRAVDVQIKSNELTDNAEVHADLLAKFTGKEEEDVLRDISRDKYMSPEDAIAYGICDQIIQPKDLRIDRKDYDRILQATGQQQRPAGRSSWADGPQAGDEM